MKREITCCDGCGREIRPGEPVIQVRRGWHGIPDPAILPSGRRAYSRVAEYHPGCVKIVECYPLSCDAYCLR